MRFLRGEAERALAAGLLSVLRLPGGAAGRAWRAASVRDRRETTRRPHVLRAARRSRGRLSTLHSTHDPLVQRGESSDSAGRVRGGLQAAGRWRRSVIVTSPATATTP